jgi:hypothetical protein
MATLMVMEWPGVTVEQYSQVMAILDLDTTPARGAILHIAGMDGSTLHVVDVWESAEAFEQFQRERLNAAVQEAGISGEPRMQFATIHNIYAPRAAAIQKAGTSALPLSA